MRVYVSRGESASHTYIRIRVRQISPSSPTNSSACAPSQWSFFCLRLALAASSALLRNLAGSRSREYHFRLVLWGTRVLSTIVSGCWTFSWKRLFFLRGYFRYPRTANFNTGARCISCMFLLSFDIVGVTNVSQRVAIL